MINILPKAGFYSKQEMSLELLARIWFYRSPAQHAVIVRQIRRRKEAKDRV